MTSVNSFSPQGRMPCKYRRNQPQMRQLAGNRIRERRVALGLRQQTLAQSVGISPSYLNLIEHNRRRIGGRLLLQIAEALSVDPAQLSEGAESATISRLQAAAAAMPASGAEGENAPLLAERFPDWASLVVRQQDRIEELERLVAALTDRLSHDPQLAASIHDILSVVTAVRATAGILAGEDDLDPEWLSRFHRNIYEDSVRLAGSAQALVAYLGETEIIRGEEGRASLPQEEFDRWISGRGFHIAELEGDQISQDVMDSFGSHASSEAGADYIDRFVSRYRSDAEALPLELLLDQISAMRVIDPVELGRRNGASLAAVLRRLATLPPEQAPECGLVLTDMAGAITFSRPIEGFTMPRLGSGCTIWPVFQALQRPMVPIRRILKTSGNQVRRFLTYSVAEPVGAPSIEHPPLFEAAMLILPCPPEFASDPALEVGGSCRICPKPGCEGRREASVYGSDASAF